MRPSTRRDEQAACKTNRSLGCRNGDEDDTDDWSRLGWRPGRIQQSAAEMVAQSLLDDARVRGDLFVAVSGSRQLLRFAGLDIRRCVREGTERVRGANADG